MLNKHQIVQTLKLSTLSWFALLIVLSAFIEISLWLDKNEQKDEFTEYAEEIKHIYEEQGPRAILKELELTHRPKWTDEEAKTHLLEEEWLVAGFRDGKLMLGADTDLPTADTPTWFTLSLEDDAPTQVLTTTLYFNEYAYAHFWQKQEETQRLKGIFAYELLAWFIPLSWLTLCIFFAFITRQDSKPIQTIIGQLDDVAQAPDSARIKIDTTDPQWQALGQSINTMLDEIVHLHNNMKTMSVGIAHDLKTPLSRVSNRLQSMYQDIDDAHALHFHLEKANQDLTHIITTFNNLVRLNAIESGKHIQGFSVFNLSELVNELALSYQPVFEDSGRQFEISVVPSVQCYGDRDLISQLLCNLLENALEYANNNAQVWIRLQSHTQSALLQIGDDGPGIPDKDKHKVFDKFYRADISRSKPGNGLGLSIVKAICDVHNAQLCLLDKQQGAVFNIEIPMP